MAHQTLKNIADQIVAQLKDTLGSDVDDVLAFDGTLSVALDRHFGQRVHDGMKKFVFVSFDHETAEMRGGAGQMIVANTGFNLYAIVRVDGRSKYEDDLDRLYDISDKITYEAFECPRIAGFAAAIGGAHFVERRAGFTPDPSYLAHLVRFNFRPINT